MWLNQNFLLTEELEGKNSLELNFLILRNNGLLSLVMDGSGSITVKTDDMDLAGDIVQSLGIYLGMEDLATTAHFPAEISSLEKLLSGAEELQVRVKILYKTRRSVVGFLKQNIVSSECEGETECGHGGPQRGDQESGG